MLRPDRFIASCASWSEFWEGTKRLSSTTEKGAVFERLTQLYLQTVPEYQSELASQLSNWGQLFENERTEAVTSLRDL